MIRLHAAYYDLEEFLECDPIPPSRSTHRAEWISYKRRRAHILILLRSSTEKFIPHLVAGVVSYDMIEPQRLFNMIRDKIVPHLNQSSIYHAFYKTIIIMARLSMYTAVKYFNERLRILVDLGVPFDEKTKIQLWICILREVQSGMAVPSRQQYMNSDWVAFTGAVGALVDSGRFFSDFVEPQESEVSRYCQWCRSTHSTR
ncbi:hypothetical protein F4778DRAFT_718783 [Xylariomycetidae sp. FL2044]|nr:hypothetical protein F4778DRAFT_718783 [Xylariomycetidae sp. FL2044]